MTFITVLLMLIATCAVAVVITTMFIHKVLLEIKSEVGFIRFMWETKHNL